MSKLYGIGKFSALTGLPKPALRRMHKKGELIPEYISSGGTRYYSEDQLNYFKRNKDNDLKNNVIINGLKGLKEELEKKCPNVLKTSISYCQVDWKEIMDIYKNLTEDEKNKPFNVEEFKRQEYTFEEIIEQAIEKLSSK